MKFGAKDYFEEDFLDFFADKADFLEVQGLRNHNYDFIKKYKLPIVVHAEHHKQGSNPCDPNCKTNLVSLQNSLKIADSVNGKKIILHPGKLNSNGTSINHSIKFVKKIKDNRILIENMIVNNEIKAPCADPEEMKMYLEETSKGLIFDLAHAMISANYIGADRIEYIKKFLKLKPMHFHISGQDLKSLHDEHRALHECDIDWYEILRMFPKDAEVTMEVSQDVKKTAKDLSMIRNVVRKIA